MADKNGVDADDKGGPYVRRGEPPFIESQRFFRRMDVPPFREH